jgi:hypothetical protein
MSPTLPRRRPRHWPLPTPIPCATWDLLLKHLDVTVATYKRRQMKYLKQPFKTLAKTFKKHLKTIAKICNVQMKHLQTYV